MSQFYSFLKHGELIWELAKRDIFDKYAGQIFGLIWVFLHPIILILVYIFVFGVIFNLKFDQNTGVNYASYLLSGIIPWLSIVEIMNKSSVVLSSNRSLVKQVVFPIEVLPVKSAVSTLVTQLILWVSFLIYLFIVSKNIGFFILLLPVSIFLQFLFMLGIAFLLSIFGAVLRDVKDIIQIVAVIGMYVLPIIYLPSMIPAWISILLKFNPLSHMVWVYQDICFYGEITHPTSWIIWIILSISTYLVGILSFNKFKIVVANYV